MNLRRLLFHDLGRKLLAALLAIGVWWQVNKGIVRTETITLEVKTVRHVASIGRDTLEVRVPPGWVLREPSQVAVSFRGATAKLNSFLDGDPIGAAYDFVPASMSWRDGETVAREPVRSSQFAWRRERLSKELLAEDAGGQIDFIFEREKSVTCSLSTALIDFSGAAADNHRELRERSEFTPNLVTFTGPASAVDELDALLKGAGTQPDRPFLGVFEPLDLAGAREDIRGKIGLHPNWRKRDVALSVPEIDVRVPVRFQSWGPVFFTERLVKVHYDAEQPWEYSPRAPRWQALLDRLPELNVESFNEAWVEQHLILFIDYSQIPRDADEYDLPIHWAITGVETPEEEAALRAALHVQPEQPESWKIRVTRGEKNP